MMQMDTPHPLCKVGFSMHPNWVRGQALRAFLDPLRAAGLTALEFELDSNDPTWPEFGPLMEACRELGYTLCFHAPYRGQRTIAGFADEGGEEMVQSLAPLYEIAAQYGPATIVVHGARSSRAERRRDLLYADTIAFLDWALEEYPTLTLALENLTPRPDMVKIGDSRAELLHIVREIQHPNLGICWDIGHDVNAGRVEPPGPIWLRQVRHVHIHDLNHEGQDHFPFLYGRVEPQRWLPPVIGAGFSGIVTLELNGPRCAFLWPERIMPALVDSIRAIADALRPPGGGAEHPNTEETSPSCQSGSGEGRA